MALAAMTVASCTDEGEPVAGSLPSPTPTVTVADPSAVPAPTAGGSTGDLSAFMGQRLRWSACQGSFECATLRVPIDYANPNPDRVLRLPVLRNPRDGSGRRVLVVNPGGPGGSGWAYAARSDAVLPGAVRERFDVVGFDPRGVQRSEPAIECVSDATLGRFIDSPAATDNAVQQLRFANRFARGCARRSPDLVGRVGTIDAARDLDLLRSALGQRRLDYLGKSYGTLLGITYAELFPDRAGRMVLDGVIDPALEAEPMLRGQAAGFERAFRSYLRSCVAAGSCPLGSTTDAAYARTVQWLDELDADPMPAAGGRQLTRSLAELALIGSLYEDRVQWAALTRALRSVFAGSPEELLAISDAAVDRDADGSFANNGNEAQYAVTCLDRAYDATLAQTTERAEEFASRYPVFGEYLAWGDLPCTRWRADPTRQAHRVTGSLPPLLLVGITRDPATPYGWARSLRAQLPSSRLVTWRGDGHTGYFRGSGCVDAVVDRYLLEGTLPGSDPTCTGR